MTKWEFGQMLALATAELAGLLSFFWFLMHGEYLQAAPGLLVFGVFRHVFNREADRIRAKYDCPRRER